MFSSFVGLDLFPLSPFEGISDQTVSTKSSTYYIFDNITIFHNPKL